MSAFDHYARGDRVGQQFEISAPPSRLHISQCGAGAAAIGDIGVDPPKALDDIGIEVADDREPCFCGSGQKCIADRQVEPRRLYGYRAAVPMLFIGAACVRLSFLEVRQHLIEGPSATAKLRPLVVFERVAAQIKHAVDAARTAKNTSLEP